MNTFMEIAFSEARRAYKKGEVPVGAVIVKNGKVLSKAHNMREKKQNALYHAEIMAINKACKKLHSWRLNDCEMYVTLEPCMMCSGAIVNSRINKIHIGAMDEKSGFSVSKYDLSGNLLLNHKVEIVQEYCEQCSKIIKDFFKKAR